MHSKHKVVKILLLITLMGGSMGVPAIADSGFQADFRKFYITKYTIQITQTPLILTFSIQRAGPIAEQSRRHLSRSGCVKAGGPEFESRQR